MKMPKFRDLESLSEKLKRMGQKLKSLASMLRSAHHDEPEIDDQLDDVRTGLGLMLDELAESALEIANILGEMPFETNSKETKS